MHEGETSFRLTPNFRRALSSREVYKKPNVVTISKHGGKKRTRLLIQFKHCILQVKMASKWELQGANGEEYLCYVIPLEIRH